MRSTVSDAPAVEVVEQLGRVREIADVPEPADVRRMRLDRARIAVGAKENGEPRLLKTEAETAGAAEEVDRRGRVALSSPSAEPPRDSPGRARMGAAAGGDRPRGGEGPRFGGSFAVSQSAWATTRHTGCRARQTESTSSVGWTASARPLDRGAQYPAIRHPPHRGLRRQAPLSPVDKQVDVERVPQGGRHSIPEQTLLHLVIAAAEVDADRRKMPSRSSTRPT